MRVQSRIIVTILLLLAVAKTSATEYGQFEYRASLNFGTAVDITANPENVFVLSAGQLTILDANPIGPELTPIETIPIPFSLRLCAASQSSLVLSSPTGLLQVFSLEGESPELSSSLSLPDSIQDIQLHSNLLLAACGYSGTYVIDIVDPSYPQIVRTLQESDYADGIEVAGEFLYVRDLLNGVVVYRNISGDLEYLDLIELNQVPLDLAGIANGLVICYGNSVLEHWNLTSGEGAEFESDISVEFPVSMLERADDGEDIWIAGDRGNVAQFSVEDQSAITAFQLNHSLLDLESAGSEALILDQSGRITLIPNGYQEGAIKIFRTSASPLGFAATDDGIIISSATGLEKISDTQLRAVSQSLLGEVSVFSSLAIAGPYLVCALAGDGMIIVFKHRGRSLELLTELDLTFDPRQLFALFEEPDLLTVVATGSEKAAKYSFDGEASPSLDWSFEFPRTIAVADYSRGILATVSEYGELAVYGEDDLGVFLVDETTTAGRPRDIEIAKNNYICTSHEDGIRLFLVEIEDLHVSEQNFPSAISRAFDIFYDDVNQELLVATGQSPVHYLDFSDPTRLGLVYPIPSSEGTTRIDLLNNKLYCMSGASLTIFERIGESSEKFANPHLVSNIVAAPNPFNTSTNITIELNPTIQFPAHLEVSLVNILGQTIARKGLTANSRTLQLDFGDIASQAAALPSGVYLFVTQTDAEISTRKLLLLK